MKTLVIISDLHCGSVYGLTPPGWYSSKSHHKKLQDEAWSAYRKMYQKWAKPDVLLVNGDCIEGRQSKQGGAELITNDRNVQVEMAVYCIKQWEAKEILLSYGSKYHVGDGAEDFEFTIAKDVKGTIEGKLFFKMEGLVIDARHKVASSTVPYGRATPLIKDSIWNMLKSAREEEPRADIIIRSHVHYYQWIEDAKKTLFTTPSLQLARGRFGSRECVGDVNWGAIRLTIDKGAIVRKEIEICELTANKPRIYRVA